jgi:energy-converting hydrogenase Eha subunit A
MLVSLKLGAPMNRLPPEPARTSSVIFSTKVLAAGIEIRRQAKLPATNNGGALCLCASAFTRAAAAAPGTKALAAHSK